MNALFLVEERVVKLSSLYKQLPLMTNIKDNLGAPSISTLSMLIIFKLVNSIINTFAYYYSFYKKSKKEEKKKKFEDALYQEKIN